MLRNGLIKQPPDNTGSNYDNRCRLAFVIIKGFAFTVAASALSVAFSRPFNRYQAIAQPVPTPPASTPPVSTPAHSADAAHQIEAVANYLEGVMSTTEQAENDPNFVGVQMTTCRIEVSAPQPDSIYLYQEQALTASLDSPYRQRFLQITPETDPGDSSRIESRTFKPDNTEDWRGLCDQPSRVVASTELGEQACIISLRPAAIGGFVGSTPAGGCATTVRGAVSITNVVVLHDRGMDTWDRGFDAEGNRVWGAQDVPYQYRRER